MKRTNPPSAEPTKPSKKPAERDLSGTNESSEGFKESSKSKPAKGASEPKPDSIPAVTSVPLGLSLSGADSASDHSKGSSPETKTAEPGSNERGGPKLEPQPPHPSSGAKVPPILFESDEPNESTAAGPDQKFAAAASLPSQVGAGPAELPQSYGTGRLLLTARDPGCLYAHWDLSPSQQRDAGSAHQQLVLRIHQNTLSGPVLAEQAVGSESRHAFVPVNAPANKYVAQLGFYAAGNTWQSVTGSAATTAPTEPKPLPGPIQFATLTFPVVTSASAESSGQRATVPAAPDNLPPIRSESTGSRPVPATLEARGENLEFPLVTLTRTADAAAAQGRPAEPVLPQLESQEDPSMPWVSAPSFDPPSIELTAGQQEALAELIGWSPIQHQGLGSGEIEALIRGKSAISSEAAAPLPPPGRGAFWLSVNAELVIYGATQPDAAVTIGGRPVALGPDGSFSCRFALPDGSHQLAVAAVSPHGDRRRVELEFHRATARGGDGSSPV